MLARATNPSGGAEGLEAARPGTVVKDIFWRAGPDGEWTAAIPTWETFTGIEGADPRGDRWLELLHPADRARTKALWDRCVATRQHYRNEYRIRQPGGGWRHIAVRGIPMLAPDGSVHEWIGHSEDVTEGRLARQALDHERAMLERLARGGSLETILTELVEGHEHLHPGTMGSVLLCDAEGAHLLHGAAPSLPPEYSKAVHGAPIGPEAGSCGTAAFRGETVIVADIETDPLWAAIKHHALAHGLRACWSTPIRSRRGKILGTFALYYREPRAPSPEELSAVEIGARLASIAIERKLEEDAALEWKKRYEAVIHASGQLLYDWDPATNRVTYGGDALRVLGCAIDELGADLAHWIEIVHPEDRERFRKETERVLASKEPFHASYRVRRKDGTHVDVQDDGYFVLDEEGRITRMVGLIMDVTDRKRTEDQARQTQKMKAIGELAGGVAHDFNNQLAAILGYADVLTRRLEDPELMVLANGIGAAARRSADLTQKLLAFARKGQIQRVPVDVHRLIAETVTILERSLDKRIRVEQRLSSRASVVSGDPSLLQSALLNLSLNSRDAMPGGGTLTFETALVGTGGSGCGTDDHEIQGQHLRIAVIDTGCGMDAEARKHLFEPFFTTKPIGKGTGMGLASVYGTVQGHGGSIRVESTKEVGTTVTICLPVSASTGTETTRGEAERPYAKRPMRVLVVDDEEALRAMIPRMLRSERYEGLTASNGAEAVELYAKRAREIDLVILDMMMPGLTASDTFRALRAIRADVRVLLSSGYSIDGEARGLLEQGAMGFLQKPFLIAELEAAIARIVEA
jgi:PAS domain S-box-containing protein